MVIRATIPFQMVSFQGQTIKLHAFTSDNIGTDDISYIDDLMEGKSHPGSQCKKIGDDPQPWREKEAT